jgi:hypothetical protein
MGLDMYLTARKPVYSYMMGEEKYAELSTEVRKLVPLAKESWQFRGFTFNAMYWRKANQIHKWFVDNVQKGVDDCGSYYVSKEELEMLVTLCERVLAHPELAPKFLPSQSGFFFGSTDYDEYYFQDLKDTVAGLKPLLSDEMFKEFDFEYQSSW